MPGSAPDDFVGNIVRRLQKAAHRSVVSNVRVTYSVLAFSRWMKSHDRLRYIPRGRWHINSRDTWLLACHAWLRARVLSEAGTITSWELRGFWLTRLTWDSDAWRYLNSMYSTSFITAAVKPGEIRLRSWLTPCYTDWQIQLWYGRNNQPWHCCQLWMLAVSVHYQRAAPQDGFSSCIIDAINVLRLRRWHAHA